MPVLVFMHGLNGNKEQYPERMKALVEKFPIYVLKAGKDTSPLLESPLGLFNPDLFGNQLEERYGIPRRRLTGLMSPWATKRC